MSSSTLTRLAPTQVALEIPVSSDELAAAEERAFRKLVKTVRLPGFRPGKVPRKVFEQNYGSAAITNQAIEDVLPEVYAKAIREHDLVPVDRPQMEVLESEAGRPKRLKATVEVRPEIPLQQYRGIVVEQPPVEVRDEDVERSIAALAAELGTLVPVDRPAQIGDVVTIDYAGTIDGEPFEGGSAEGRVVELREERLLPGMAAGIAGMKAGEHKDITAEFPADAPEAAVAGKTATFGVTLHDVKELELPKIDDEFARRVSKTETMDDLRRDVRARLTALGEARAHRAAGNVIMQRLLASHDFPLPASLVEGEIERLVEDATADAARSGSSLDEWLQKNATTQEQLRERLRQEASSRVKGTLLIERIADAEGIVATPADVSRELDAMARQYGQPVGKIREALGNGILSLMSGIVRQKTLDFLIEHADVRTVPEATPAEAP